MTPQEVLGLSVKVSIMLAVFGFGMQATWRFAHRSLAAMRVELMSTCVHFWIAE